MKLKIILLLIASSLGVAHASVDDCNSLMKSRWESSLSDLATLRINLDTQRAQGLKSIMTHAIENAYARKFGELLETQKKFSIEGDLETLLKKKISEQQKALVLVAEEFVAQAVAQKEIMSSLVAHSEKYSGLPWTVKSIDAKKIDENHTIVAALEENFNRFQYAKFQVDDKTYRGFSATVPQAARSVYVIDESTIIIETDSELLKVDQAARKLSRVYHFTASDENRQIRKMRDGQLLISGGYPIDKASGDVILFNPYNLSSRVLPSLAHPRLRHQTVELSDGRILVIGGENWNGKSTTEIEIINPALNTIEHFGDLPESRVIFTATVLSDDRVVLVGGAKSILIIDVAAKRIESIGELSDNFYEMSATVLPDDRIVVTGGYNGFEKNQSSIFLVDPNFKLFDQIGTSLYPSMNAVTTQISDDEMIIWSGRNSAGSNGVEKLTLKKVYR